MKINDYMSPSEAAYRWGVSENTLKERLKPSRRGKDFDSLIEKGLIKYFIKPGGKRAEWIITREFMEKFHGKEL